MLLVTHSADKRLRLYRITIDFQQMLFSAQHVKTIDHCSPLEQTDNSSPKSYDSSCLSHLQILPPGPETRHREPKDPFILAIFSQIPDQTHDPTTQEGLSTVLARWQLCSQKPKLNTSFEQLIPKKLSGNFPGDLPVGVDISLQRICSDSLCFLAGSFSQKTWRCCHQQAPCLYPRTELEHSFGGTIQRRCG
jgi:hypothetical protein